MSRSPETGPQLAEFASRNISSVFDMVPDDVSAWVDRYLALAVAGVRSDEVAHKIELHLRRFGKYLTELFGQARISTIGRRDVVGWQRHLAVELAPATVNNHLASLSGFTSWATTQVPDLFVGGDPTIGVGVLPLPALEPRSLSERQVRSLKNLCDRLERFTERKSATGGGRHGHARPVRDRAIVFVLLSTGLRRDELVRLDLDQIEPADPAKLRNARSARLVRVRGKGGTERTVFLSTDARTALADYLETERADDADGSDALFVSAASVATRRAGGRLSSRSINTILERIGRWHDSEFTDPDRHVSPLRPHDLRHTFAFRLAEATGADSYELERRLGHRSQRYIARYTNPPDEIAAGYIEDM